MDMPVAMQDFDVDDILNEYFIPYYVSPFEGRTARQVVRLQLDTDANTLRCWVDGARCMYAHWPAGCAKHAGMPTPVGLDHANVFGTFRWAMRTHTMSDSVQITPNPELNPLES